MKIKFQKKKSGWHAGYWRGKGGINSLIVATNGTFWHCLKSMFKNLAFAIKHEYYFRKYYLNSPK